jgi:hypothetical protein
MESTNDHALAAIGYLFGPVYWGLTAYIPFYYFMYKGLRWRPLLLKIVLVTGLAIGLLNLALLAYGIAIAGPLENSSITTRIVVVATLLFFGTFATLASIGRWRMESVVATELEAIEESRLLRVCRNIGRLSFFGGHAILALSVGIAILAVRSGLMISSTYAAAGLVSFQLFYGFGVLLRSIVDPALGSGAGSRAAT